MTNAYYRPIICHGTERPDGALPLAGGPLWFSHAARHMRDAATTVVGADDIPEDWRQRLTAARTPIEGMVFDRPRIMGILNVTPDSFSDGGTHHGAARAVSHALQMVQDGAHIIDVGGESTRPGAQYLPIEAEIARIEPVVAALRHELDVPLSIDTRKHDVAEVAVGLGARIVNDVSGFTHDTLLAPFCAAKALPVCVMHAQGDPETMQNDPRYDDVLLDVYDFLDTQITKLEALGLPRSRIIVDPGIGFGKKIPHNLALLQGLSLFHGLGCALLLGASRKGFIGRISGANPASERAHGSVSVALAAAAQGAQILRVHDVAETAQALAMWQAIHFGDWTDA